eukprot:CAMPEP_0118950670 /NCGR_PEP_ID=MMETSP1169-20130426/51793_1 /TAXON_ID=36882 /ORGANISM="Pyramimonas obovata, Strain CCMP722" /LENGTH=345 /DNA_ID=CAMNT_0006897559 /DNA_START=163 /DNA_END=1197 /DNA_ORIENTATION=+
MGCGVSKKSGVGAPLSTVGTWNIKAKQVSATVVAAQVHDVEHAVDSAMLFARLSKLKEDEPCEYCAEVFGGGGGFPETWNDGMTFHCSQCKQVFPGKQRQTLEVQAKELLEALDRRDAPDEPTRERRQVGRGVKVAWLKQFARGTSRAMKTYEVVQRVIQPATDQARCRYVELPEMVDHVGRAQVFVSHTWGAPFANTVAAIAHALPDCAYVWLDVFAVRQWPGNGADLMFKSIVRDTHALLLCAVHVEAVAAMPRADSRTKLAVPKEAKQVCAFFRVWCLVELHAALCFRKPIVMLIGSADEEGHFQSNTDMCENLFHCVDVRAASASVEADRARILQEVEEAD